MRVTAILVLATLMALPALAEPQAAKQAALAKIVDDAQQGRIELCRDPRWPLWRFEEGEAGLERLGALKKLADAAWTGRRDDTRGDPFAAAQEADRLSALSSIIGAVIAAAGQAEWIAAFDDAARFIDMWRVKARTLAGDSFTTKLARRSVWRLASARTSGRQPPSEVFKGIGACLLSAHSTIAEQAVLRLTVAALDQGRWPSDARDGTGAETEAMAVVRSAAGHRYVRENWQRLAEIAARGGLPTGVLALWRIALRRDPAPVSTLPEFFARFERDWASIGALLKSAAPASTIGSELYRRTRLEQYGRISMGNAAVQFEGDSKTTEIVSQIWKKVSEEDVANTRRLKDLLSSRVWFDDEVDGDGAEYFGWLIVQHADLDPDFQRDVLRRLEPLLAQGRVRSRDYAFLWDRVAVADKRPQRYGTQFSCANGAWAATGGVEDPAQLDARRKKMGLTPFRDDFDQITRTHGKCPS